MALDGVTVTTVEGLAPDGDLHPLQDAFIRHDAFQCGYCTPGRLCSAVGMLGEAGPSAIPADLETEAALTPGEIRERMSGNLCRCGAYVNIVRAIAEIASPGSGTVRAFTYTRAQDASDAVARYRTGTAYLGGGTNLVDLMRLGVATPDQLGDVSRLRYNRWRRPWTAACGLVRTVDFGGVRAMPGVLAVLPCTDPPALGSAEDPELALFTTRQVSGPGASTILLAQHYPNSPVHRLGLPRPVDRDRPQAGRRRRRRRPDHLRSRPGHRQALVEIARPHGRLDVLVNNAGTCDGGAAGAAEPGPLAAGGRVNLISVMDLGRLAADLLRAAPAASVINVASVYGIVAFRSPMAACNAPQAALINLTRHLAAVWGADGARVNALAPGYFPTELTGFLADPAFAQSIRDRTLLGRSPVPDELDGPLLFLATGASSYMTGQALVIDGGWTAV